MGQLPAGHPALGQGATGAARGTPAVTPMRIETGVPLPVPLVGPGSVAELKRRLALVPASGPVAGITRTDAQGRLDKAFRLTFTVDRRKRDPQRAVALLNPLIAPGVNARTAATAQRILAYVSVSNGFRVREAMRHYKAAIALDPSYGEAHYGLAFLYAINDRAAGRKEFDAAMKLGVSDTGGIARFYRHKGAGTPR